MPICRHQIRGEFGLADPELYRAADRDDPEAVLEGVAMAGLVGVLRQLGDLAEFAAEIFHDLHEEVMATAARGHGLMLRVQQLEEELPSMEKTFLSHNSQLQSASTTGFEWHANLRLEQSLVATGDLPRFIMDSYEECRGPPRLFLLDKFDVAGAGACLKRYSDPSFFKTEFSSSGIMKADVQREKKIRKFKTKGLFYNGGNTSDFISSTEFSSMLQDGMFNEPSNVSGKNTFHLVKLKRSNFIDSSFNLRNKKLYMEQIFKVPSPELKPVYEKSLVYSSLGAPSIDNNEAHNEICENNIMDLGTKEIPVGLIDKSTSMEYNHELVRRHSLNDPLDSANDVRKEEKVPSLPESSPKNVVNDRYSSDSNASGVDNFMDALATMDSELETSLQNRLQHEKSLLSIPSRALDSDSNDDQTELRGLSSDSYSAGSSSVSYEWKEPLKKKASSHSASDTAGSVDELYSSEENSSRLNIPCDNPSSLPVNSHHDKHTIAVEISDEASLRVFHAKNTSEHLDQIVVSPQTLSNTVEDHPLDVLPFPVDSQHGVLTSAVEIPDETSSYANRTSVHSEQLLVSPQVSSSLIEDRKLDSSPCAEEVNERIFVGSQNQSDLSSGFSGTVANAQTSGIVRKIVTSNFSNLEDNAVDNQNSQKSYETYTGADLVRDLNDSDYFVNQLMENSEPMESALSQKESISLSSPENDNADSVGLGLSEKRDITYFPNVDQSMNIGKGNKMILVGQREDSSEPELAFSSKHNGEDTSQVLKDESERIHFHKLLKDQPFADNFELVDENASLQVWSVPEVPISVDELPKVKTITDLHESDDTYKCDVDVEVPSSLSAPSLPSMSSSDNDTRNEYSGEGLSDPLQPETTELSSLDLISSSYLHEVDPAITDFLDGTENESKAEGVVAPILKINGQDSPVVDQPLSGSEMMQDSFILVSNSGSTDRSSQLVSESHFYSLKTLKVPTPLTKTQQETESLQHSRCFTSDASDTARGLMIDDDTRLISSIKSKPESEDLMLPTSLPVLPKILSEQEFAIKNSESAVGSRLEYLCVDREKVELSECTVEIAKEESSNHVSQKPSDLISSMQSAEDTFQASDVDHGHLGHMDDACEQNHELPNGRHMKGSEDVKVLPHLLDENDQLTEFHLSNGNFERTEGLGQILKIQISGEMSRDKVDDAIASEYSFQSMKQTSKEGNSSGLIGDDNDYGAQIVQQQSATVPAQFVEPSTENVSGRLHQHARGETCERIDSNSRGDLDVPSTSGDPIQSFIPIMSASGAFPGVGLLQSTDPTSSHRDTMPPLPPLPPLQWISGTFPQGPSSMGYSSPLDASEDSGPHASQAYSGTKSLLSDYNVEDQITEEVPDSRRLVMEEHTSLAVDPSPGHEEPKLGPNHVAEQNAPDVLPKQTGTNDASHPNLITPKENVGPPLNALTSVWIEENERPVSRMVIPRHKDDPLIEAVAAHDRNKLRKVSELVRSEIKPKTDDRNSFLEQIRNKSFNLKPAASARPSIHGPKTNLNVVAILEKANAIRQAFAGSDDENDDADTWSDN